MSEESVEIVRRLYRAMDARDLEAAGELTHPDAEWIPDSRVGQEPIRGRENIARFFTDRAEMFDELRMEVERFWEADDKVLAFVRVTGSGGVSGATFDIRIGHLWTVRDGVVVRGEGYGNRDEAREVAGLSAWLLGTRSADPLGVKVASCMGRAESSGCWLSVVQAKTSGELEP